MFFLAYGEWQHWRCGSSPSGYGVATAGLLQQFSVSQRLLRELAQRPHPSKMKKQFIAVLFSALLCFPAYTITPEEQDRLPVTLALGGVASFFAGSGVYILINTKEVSPVRPKGLDPAIKITTGQDYGRIICGVMSIILSGPLLAQAALYLFHSDSLSAKPASYFGKLTTDEPQTVPQELP